MSRGDPFDRIAALDARFRFLEAPGVSLPPDRALAGGPGPLSGQVIGVKSNIAVAGQVWTAGIAAESRPVAPDDAGVVTALRAAGARVLSRLKMDEAALGAATDNPHFGRAENPAAPGHSTGGSSGGSAAAVASGAVDVALGTDTLGSVRIPAGYCGVFGLKPAPGVLSEDGVFPLAPGYDAVGLLARDLPALRAVLGIVAAEQSEAAPGLRLACPAPCEAVPCAPETQAGLARARRAAQDLGLWDPAAVLDDWDPAATRKAAFVAVAHGAGARLSPLEGLSPALRKTLAYGASVPEAERATGAALLARLRDALAAEFALGRVLLTPTTPAPAFAHGARPPADQATFTALANIAGGASLAIPVPGPSARPVSVLLTGGPGTEASLLAIGAALSEALSKQPPGAGR